MKKFKQVTFEYLCSLITSSISLLNNNTCYRGSVFLKILTLS